MHRGITLCAVLLATNLVVAFALEDRSVKRIEMAKTMIAEMAAANFDNAVEPFDETMKHALPASKLQTLWDGLIQQFGPFQRATEARTAKAKYEVVFVTCEFQRGQLDAKIVFTEEMKITGLFFVPSGKYQPPSYADASAFDEREINLGHGIWRLPGTLSVPKGNGPFPAVVLIHGSGPNDRDETIGPNKPFKDLAYGLASRGIAVLRYEKRTRHYPTLMALSASTITVQEETIDDAVAAVDALASQEKIDPQRIFVLGHSLGGTLLPRIAKARDGIAGLISLAGSTRRLEDIILDQTRYILSLHGHDPEKLREIEKQVAKVKSPALTVDTPASELPLGIPARYWLDLRTYDPAQAAGELSIPMLILQGERDYQVTMEDFAGWKKTLESRRNVKFISYPKLNHLLIEGTGKSSPAEYSTAGNVAKIVIEDIAKWIQGLQQTENDR